MYIKRKLESKILKYLKTPEIIAVLGPRQCGKTTLFKKIFSDLEKAVFVSFEDKNILNMFNRNIEDFVKLYVSGNKYLFIDEFQYSKNGGKRLKYIFDSEKIKIFITGSSAVDLTIQATKHLVGRIFIFNLYPLDFSEFLSYKDVALERIYLESNSGFISEKTVPVGNEIKNKILKEFEEYSIFGGYPRVVLARDDEEKKEVLKNIYNTFFLREVRDVLGLIDDYKLGKLIKALAFQAGNLIEYKELSRTSEFAYPTLKKYLNFLKKTYVIDLVKPFYKNKRTEIVKNPKVYFLDSGLRNVIVNDFRKFEDRNDIGQIMENSTFSQLVKGGYDLNYWRNKRKSEVDFILNLPEGKTLGVEVKNLLKNDQSKSMADFEKTYPDVKVILVFAVLSGKFQKSAGRKIFPVYFI